MFPSREQAYEGKYVIQTEEPNLSAVDAVRLYKELSEVERAFADLKDVLELRPIYHQIRQPRAGAHLCRRARLSAPPRHRKETQGRTPRSVRHRSPDGAQIRPRRRYQPRRWHRQALRHDRHKPRRRSAPCPRQPTNTTRLSQIA